MSPQASGVRVREYLPLTNVSSDFLTILPHRTLYQAPALEHVITELARMQDKTAAIYFSGWAWTPALLCVILRAAEQHANLGIAFGTLTWDIVQLLQDAYKIYTHETNSEPQLRSVSFKRVGLQGVPQLTPYADAYRVCKEVRFGEIASAEDLQALVQSGLGSKVIRCGYMSLGFESAQVNTTHAYSCYPLPCPALSLQRTRAEGYVGAGMCVCTT